MGIEILEAVCFNEVARTQGQEMAADYLRTWCGAVGTHAPLPCPYCWPLGIPSRLVPRETEYGLGKVICSTCSNPITFVD